MYQCTSRPFTVQGGLVYHAYERKKAGIGIRIRSYYTSLYVHTYVLQKQHLNRAADVWLYVSQR